MSGLRAAGLGPIIGHTTDKSCRLWIRAGDPSDSGAELNEDRRTIGVIAVLEENDTLINPPRVYYFRMRREYDRTGTFNLGEETGIKDLNPSMSLKPNTKYRVRLGTLTIDDPFPNDESVDNAKLADRLPAPEIWIEDLKKLPEKQSEVVFKTFPSDSGQAGGFISFILGSCRYPGLLWKVKEADQIFGAINRDLDADSNEKIKFVLMVGDQIYADMLNRHVPIALADTFEEFQERYLTAFGSPNTQKMLKSIPTYMILDDHEISDNWTQDRIKNSIDRRIFNLAMGAYRSYQWSHGPRTFQNSLYYHYACNGYPFFVLDARTQRFMDEKADDLDDNHMLGRPSLDKDNEPSQMDRFLKWLGEQQKVRGNAPKFIVSSSVFVPNPISGREGQPSSPKKVRRQQATDSWPAFPETRRTILDFITKERIQNVVFLSGDIHCTNVAEMSFSGDKSPVGLKAFSITSSAFYWPFPFADGDPSEYVHDSKAGGQEDSFKITNDCVMDYRSWNFTQEDNYCLIEVNKSDSTLKVIVKDKKGAIVKKEDGSPLETILKLVNW